MAVKSFSQTTSTDSTIVIDDVIIAGIKKTKPYIVLREMVLHKGDTVWASQLQTKILQSKQLVFNTSLFVSVDLIAAQGAGNHITLIVDVKERWYIFPLPYFKLIDRNFNEWWVNQKASLERVDYGIKFYHNNLTGRNDKLNLSLITGYNRQVGVRYDLPFFDKKLRQGLNIGFVYSSQKELNYNTSKDNKQLFFKTNTGFAKTFYRADVTYSYRPDQFWRHYLRVSYNHENVQDTILKLNPNYFPDAKTSLTYINANYTVQYIKFNYNPYPTKGFAAQASINKRGIFGDIDLLVLQLGATAALPIGKKAYLLTEAAVTQKFPSNPYFINQPLFGYGSFQLRGQELYVVDGLAGAIAKFTLGYELLKFNLRTPFKNPAYKSIPFKFYGKVYSDFGYSHNPYIKNDLLNNRLMKTWGIGLDILSIYDLVFKIEYSFNQLGGNGLFLSSGN